MKKQILYSCYALNYRNVTSKCTTFVAARWFEEAARGANLTGCCCDNFYPLRFMMYETPSSIA